MSEVPKFVRERLRRAATPEVHPEANLLAAFAERSLGKRERNEVLEHLAQCVTCRETVFLSPPEFGQQEIAANKPFRSQWISWPVLRWAALGACVVLVSAAVTL